MKHIFKLLFVQIAFIGLNLNAQIKPLKNYRWTTIAAKGDVVGRHENSFVEYKGKFYLIGGRGINPVNVFDPITNTWETKSVSPIQIHHFQAVVYEDAIYLIGAMTGKYPKEPALENIWLYYPEKDKWVKGPEIPKNRRRGGAGTVIYKDKIYMACGIEIGHSSGTNNYFDSYNLKTGEWKTLTKAPHIRDHFPAIVVNDKMYCIGGRNTSVHYPENFGAFFAATIPYVDYYDFVEEKWYTMKETLPFPNAAGGLVKLENNLLYIGGEGNQDQAYNQTQCLDLTTGKWTQLAPLNVGRHGSGAVLYNNKVYLAAGSPTKGGGNMGSIEVFSTEHTWQPLFNGKNLDGWSIKCTDKDKYKNFWTVVDGSILCNSTNSKNHSYVWLQSNGEYANFELRFKFQSHADNKGNCGIQVRSRWADDILVADMNTEPGWMNGPQADIDPKNPWRNGFIYDETLNVRRWLNPDLPNSKIDKETFAPKKVIHYYHNQEPAWNDMTIICDGTRIQTLVNNINVSDYNGEGILNDKKHKKYKVGMKGHIAFQLHAKSQNNMRFKDIEIRIIE